INAARSTRPFRQRSGCTHNVVSLSGSYIDVGRRGVISCEAENFAEALRVPRLACLVMESAERRKITGIPKVRRRSGWRNQRPDVAGLRVEFGNNISAVPK